MAEMAGGKMRCMKQILTKLKRKKFDWENGIL